MTARALNGDVMATITVSSVAALADPDLLKQELAFHCDVPAGRQHLLFNGKPLGELDVHELEQVVGKEIEITMVVQDLVHFAITSVGEDDRLFQLKVSISPNEALREIASKWKTAWKLPETTKVVLNFHGMQYWEVSLKLTPLDLGWEPNRPPIYLDAFPAPDAVAGALEDDEDTGAPAGAQVFPPPRFQYALPS